MRLNEERFEGRRMNEENEDLFYESSKKIRKKERREKYKVKNQKVHQIDLNLEDDFEGFEGFEF